MRKLFIFNNKLAVLWIPEGSLGLTVFKESVKVRSWSVIISTFTNTDLIFAEYEETKTLPITKCLTVKASPQPNFSQTSSTDQTKITKKPTKKNINLSRLPHISPNPLVSQIKHLQILTNKQTNLPPKLQMHHLQVLLNTLPINPTIHQPIQQMMKAM